MGCLGVDIWGFRTVTAAAAKIIGGVQSFCTALKDNLAVTISTRLHDVKAFINICNSGVVAEAKPKDHGINVSVSFVCGTGLNNEYFLLVEEGYMLDIDGRYFKVIGNG